MLVSFLSLITRGEHQCYSNVYCFSMKKCKTKITLGHPYDCEELVSVCANCKMCDFISKVCSIFDLVWCCIPVCAELPCEDLSNTLSGVWKVSINEAQLDDYSSDYDIHALKETCSCTWHNSINEMTKVKLIIC